jgi:hypothetical protein
MYVKIIELSPSNNAANGTNLRPSSEGERARKTRAAQPAREMGVFKRILLKLVGRVLSHSLSLGPRAGLPSSSCESAESATLETE